MKVYIALFLAVLSSAASAQSGFTPLSPSADSRVVHVDGVEGVDTDTCGALASPCKTVPHARAKMRNGYPDHLYLKRGQEFIPDENDEWKGNIYPWSGRSASEPAVLAYYHTSGARPKIKRVAAFAEDATVQHFQVVGMQFEEGAKFTWDNEGILIEDCVFDTSELLLVGDSGKLQRNVTVRRNIFTGHFANTTSYNDDSKPSNIFVSYTDGVVIEENVIDHGGWHPTESGAGANMYNHNIYIQYDNVGNNVIVRDNIITRASSHGVHGRPGGLYENNFFAKNAINLQMGYDGRPLSEGTRAIARDNVITQGRTMAKGNDPCNPEPGSRKLCTGALWGIYTDDPGQGYFEIVGNLVAMGEDNETQWRTVLNGNIYKNPLHVDSEVVSKKVENNLIEETETATLVDYAEHIGLPRSFDSFMNNAIARSPGTWDERYTANAINNYLRAQYGMTTGGDDGNSGGGEDETPGDGGNEPPSDGDPSPTGNLLSAASFADGALQDMPNTYVLGTHSADVWMTRLGTCEQCSQLLSSGGGTYLDAGFGTTNGTFQVVEWPGSGTLTLEFDYTGAPDFRVLGGNAGDTIEKWDNANTLEVIHDGSTNDTTSWSKKSVAVELSGNYNYLVIRFVNGDIDNVSAVMDSATAQDLTSFGDFSGAALEDMPNSYTLGSDPLDVWMARVGSCDQCSQVLNSNGNDYLEAGSGTTNGTFQVVEWPGNGTFTLGFDYAGEPDFRVFGGHAGDTIGKWDSAHTLDLLYDGSTSSSSSWASRSVAVKLLGDYDFLIVRFHNGEVDNVSAVMNLSTVQDVANFGDFNGPALQDMPSSYTLGSDAENVWVARLGSCDQCSQLLTNDGNTYLDAGSGTTNGAFQAIPWPGSASLTLNFDYLGGPGVHVYGGHVGDTIGRWDNSHTLDLLHDGVVASRSSWTAGSVTTNLVGDFDYLVIQFRHGDVDNVTATVSN